MKTNELMVGDWVEHLGYPTIVGVIQHQIFPEEPGQINTRSDTEYLPILITEDILKLNGFKPFKWTSDSYNLNPHISVTYQQYGIQITSINTKVEEFLITGRGLNKLKLHYIHELQHALRLCGLIEPADNFKVSA